MAATLFDLDAYFRRIGYAGPREPSLPVLRAVVAAQAASVPFENLDVLGGLPIALDAAALQRKLLADGRGGYCFELNTLLLHALAAMGFKVAALAARVFWNRPEGVVPPRTHVLLRVELPEGAYLADVGFGGATPTAPLALVPGAEQATPLEPFRLAPAGRELDLQIGLASGWPTLYRLSLEEQLAPDRELANWFVSTHPSSMFRQQLIAARPTPKARYGLRDGELHVRHRDGRSERRRLDDPAGLLEVLARDFLIRPRNEAERLAWLRLVGPMMRGARGTVEASQRL